MTIGKIEQLTTLQKVMDLNGEVRKLENRIAELEDENRRLRQATAGLDELGRLSSELRSTKEKLARLADACSKEHIPYSAACPICVVLYAIDQNAIAKELMK